MSDIESLKKKLAEERARRKKLEKSIEDIKTLCKESTYHFKKRLSSCAFEIESDVKRAGIGFIGQVMMNPGHSSSQINRAKKDYKRMLSDLKKIFLLCKKED